MTDDDREHDGRSEDIKREYRCQGCGELAGEDKINFVKAAANRQVRYCNRCETVRKHFDIRVEDHPQYRLMELADDIVEADDE